ncbi:MAG: transcription termination factor Rho [Lachnospiraceae bacterium]|nr:transcription termination factor Rho [Lachnospiraceae bacterium]
MDFNLLTLAQLKDIAKEENIKGVSGLKKEELIAVLEKNSKKKAETKATDSSQAKASVKKAAKPAEETAKKAVAKPAEEKTLKKAPAKSADETAKKAVKPAEENTPKKAPAKPVPAADAAKVVKPLEKPAAPNKEPETGEVRKNVVTRRVVRTPSGEMKTVPVSPAPANRQIVRKDQGNIRRIDNPDANQGAARASVVKRVVPGSEQRQVPTARPVQGDQRRVIQGHTAQANDQRQPQPALERGQGATQDGAGHTETVASYIAQNYALAGTPQDSGETKEGILEVMPEGFAFVRCDNFLPGNEDVYVSPAQVKRFGLKTGDYIVGNTKVRMPNEKFSALYYISTVNKLTLDEIVKRKRFEDLTPIFPNQRFHLETPGCGPAMRMVDLLSPIGKGQRGMIVSQPKAGKTTLLKQIAKALIRNHPSIHLIILLIDERPEEVTDMKESINGDNVEVIYSTFDEQPENHRRVSEMVIERARRLVEQKQDVVILLDSITRLARAYNLTVQASGRTLSGGLDPAALHMPKKFFGAARCMREGGSLTVLATALVETGSRMDDVVFEEFKGTGNMELVLDRNLSERRVFPAIDLPKSGTRREDLLLTPQELEASNIIRRAFNSARTDEVVERIINLFTHTRNNLEFVEMVKKTRIVP